MSVALGSGAQVWRASVFARARTLLLLGLMVLMAALLSVFAVVITDSQAQSRRETEKRFAAQATISAALTESLFRTAARQTRSQGTKAFSGKRIAPETVAAAVKSSQLRYLAIVDANGHLLVASPGTPLVALRRLATPRTHVEEALQGQSALSDLYEDGNGAYVIEWATPFDTPYGRRVRVSGLSAGPIAEFVGTYLARMARGAPGEQVVLVDSRHTLIASANAHARLGSSLGDAALRSELVGRTEGRYQAQGGERFFASAPVGGSTWRVLVSRPTKSFYPNLAGSGAWVVWALFGGFAAALALGLYFVFQTLRQKVQLAATNRELAAVNATLEQRVAERTAVAEHRAAQLARSNAELEQFAYVASHDLQEPLRKIQAFGQRLEAKHSAQLDAEGVDYLQRMQAAATRMRSLINDLLTFSRVASRAGAFEPIELTTVVSEAVSDLEIQVEESGGRVEIGQLPTIEADPEQMRRLMQNLIGNALKFRRDGEPPLVRVQGRILNGHQPGAGNGARFCELTVEDNGIGFDQQYLERIFVIFQRLHARNEYAGTGIGLAVCRKIVDRHDGAITATSEPGRGSTFTLRLPVEQSKEGAQT